MTHTKFIYITDNILIKEEKVVHISTSTGEVEDVYEYYLGDDFVFGVKKRFTGNDLRMLHMNGYFDMWLEKEEA